MLNPVMGVGLNFGDRITSTFAAGAVLSVHRQGRIPRHAHKSSYMCFVLSGSFVDGSLDPGDKIEAGDAIGYPEGEIHDNEFVSPKVVCLNLHTAEARLHSENRKRRLVPQARQLAIDMAINLLSGKADTLTHDGLHAELTEFLLEGPPARCRGLSVNGVMALLADEPDRYWALVDLATYAGCSPTHLARAFRRATGSTLGTWRRRCRVLKLCADLKTGREELSQLAYRHGFADQAHMTREVKLFAGRTPLAVRRGC